MGDSNRSTTGTGTVRAAAGGPAQGEAAIPAPLRSLKFSLEAQLARGVMSVAQLMRLAPGSVVASKTAPGGRIRLMSGPVHLARVSPVVEEGRMLLRVDDLEEE